MGTVDGKAVDPMEIVEPVRDLGVLDDQGFGLLEPFIKVSEQVAMVGFLDRKNEVVAMVLEKANIWAVGTDPVLGHNDLEMGMFLPEFDEASPAGIELTIVLCGAVLAGDDLGNQGDHFFSFRMDQGGSQHLKRIGNLAVSMDFYLAMV